MRIVRNAARCRKCGAEVESTHLHHYQACPCGAIAVDGGHDYLRRVAKDSMDDVIELSDVIYPGAKNYEERMPTA